MRYTLLALYAIIPSFFANANTDFTKEIVGTSKNWTIIKANPNGNSVCYAILYTQARNGNQTVQAEKPHIMVHYFTETKVRFSKYFGYKLLEGQPVHLSIDSNQYKISSLNEYAIASSSQQDDEIIKKLKGASTLLIRGEGANYSYSVDTYNIEGFDKAFEIMQKNCDLNSNNSAFKKITPEKSDIKKLPTTPKTTAPAIAPKLKQ